MLTEPILESGVTSQASLMAPLAGSTGTTLVLSQVSRVCTTPFRNPGFSIRVSRDQLLQSTGYQPTGTDLPRGLWAWVLGCV
jgi:hypothetical protein